MSDFFIANAPSPAAIVAALRLRGLYAVTPAAVDCISRQCVRESEPAAALARLAEALAAARGADAGAVDTADVADIVADATRDGEDARADALAVVAASAMPRWAYDPARRAYTWCVRRSAGARLVRE